MSPVVSIQFFKVSQGKSDKYHLIIPRHPAHSLHNLIFFISAHQIRRTRDTSFCLTHVEMEKQAWEEHSDQGQGWAEVMLQISDTVTGQTPSSRWYKALPLSHLFSFLCRVETSSPISQGDCQGTWRQHIRKCF